jgi:hypothetical protein
MSVESGFCNKRGLFGTLTNNEKLEISKELVNLAGATGRPLDHSYQEHTFRTTSISIEYMF